MGRDLYDSSSSVRELFAAASEQAGRDLAKLIFDGSEQDLSATDVSQVAITVVSLAALRLLTERGITSDGCAGFSLGEYAAFVDSGVLTEEQALRLVAERGRIMEQVSRSLDTGDERPGMAAVIGLTPETVATALGAELAQRAFAANLNSPKQTVISGTAGGLAAAAEVLTGMGARRVIPLKVSGPFHSPLMQDARNAFGEVLADEPFADPMKPLYSNVTGAVVARGEEIRTLCARQLTEPVRWIDEERTIAAAGFEQLLEVGPGTVLAGLWKTFVGAEVAGEGDQPPRICVPAGTMEQIDELAGA
jgi:[acyl-carrier-protein] S-malonyltransferase